MLLEICLLFLFLYVCLYYKNVRRYPPGPLPLPFIGNLYHIRPDNLHLHLHELSKTYGKCYTLFLPKAYVVLADYAHIKEALHTQGDAFSGRSNCPPDTLFHRKPNIGIAISEGENWKEQRRISTKILRTFGFGTNIMERQILESIDEMMTELKEQLNHSDIIDMKLTIQLCVANVINKILFGYHYTYNDTRKFEQKSAILYRHMKYIKESKSVLLVQNFPWMRHVPYIGYYGYTKITENISEFHKFIEEEVVQQAKALQPDQIPENFIHAYIAEMREGNASCNMDNLFALALDFWSAGMETTTTTLYWALLLLVKHQDIQDQLHAELDRVIGRNRTITMSDKSNLPLFVSTLYEIQRVANIAPVILFHKCTNDSIVQGKPIPAGSLIMPQIHSVLAHDPAFENPEEFRANRFLLEDQRTLNKNLLEYCIPFGIGKRICLGEGLAKMELFLILGSLLQRYQFEPTDLPVDTTPVFGAILSPKPYRVRLIHRK